MWKWTVAQIQEGELSNAGIISLSDSRNIKPASETDPYKYLGVLQVFDADQEDTRQAVIKPYMRRVERVWSSELNAKHKSSAMKSWATRFQILLRNSQVVKSVPKFSGCTNQANHEEAPMSPVWCCSGAVVPAP